MAGTIVTNATNYNGELDAFLYEVIETGADFLRREKAAAYLLTGVRYKKELDIVEYDTDPIEDYTTGNPTFASGAQKDKRDIAPRKMTVSGKFNPDEWLAEWDAYAPGGSLTELKMNPAFLRRVIQLALNKAKTQIDKLFWQGDITAGGASPLRFFDGIITKLIADSDGDVNFVTPAGVITQANVVNRIVDMYKAIPDKFLEDMNYKIHMSMTDYKLLQLFNNDAKKTTVGVLDEGVKSLFLNKRIVPFVHLPKDHMVGARTTLNPDSNFVFSPYFSLDQEFGDIKVARIENLGKEIGYRVDFMADVQYRHGGDVSLYKPV